MNIIIISSKGYEGLFMTHIIYKGNEIILMIF